MRLTGNQNEIRGVRRFVIVAICAAFGIGICASALALSTHVEATSAVSGTPSSSSGPVKVSAQVMAGNKLSGPDPEYPEEAKKAKIQGTVVLGAVIDKDGIVRELRVVSGPKELRISSLDAVRQWTYKPYLLNGNPIEVETSINVTYTLGN